MDKPFDPVIRPAIRVNKADKPEQPKCKNCGNKNESCKTIEREYRSGEYPCYKYEPKTKNSKVAEQPNTELMIIKTIQGLISAVNRELGKLYVNKLDEITYQRQAGRKAKAIEEIDLFEKTTLFELQKAFE